MVFFSITIPTYEMGDYGSVFLEHSLSILNNQTYKNFEIIISDHSRNDNINSIFKKWRDILNIKYFRNIIDIGSSSSNLNSAIRNCTGEYIKILFQDDFLYDEYALENTYNTINKNADKKWFASNCEHSNDGVTCYRPFYAKWDDRMIYGFNTISSPSVITIKNDDSKLFFDKDYIWLMDCDYYQRCYNKFGLPTIIPEITVVNRTWQNQLTNIITDENKKKEHYQILKKYKVIR